MEISRGIATGASSATASRSPTVRPFRGITARKLPCPPVAARTASCSACTCGWASASASLRTSHVAISAHGGALREPAYSKYLLPDKRTLRSMGLTSSPGTMVFAFASGRGTLRKVCSTGLALTSVEFRLSIGIATINTAWPSYLLCTKCNSSGVCRPANVCSDSACTLMVSRSYQAFSYVMPPIPRPASSAEYACPLFFSWNGDDMGW
mmetsp:Transcript_49366/g.143097  ORF Transcript_49366/g.143097 Transcript_49366/m.143097 type:complete len:209 (-) Transcript_49366:265-891(-)